MFNWLNKVTRSDWLLVAAISLLLILSLVLIYGISLNDPTSNYYLFKKQVLFVFLAVVGFLIVSQINYRFWQTFSKLFYWLGATVLTGVLIFGATIRGTTGWISIAGFAIQPVEFAKIALIIFLAYYFSRYAREFFLWRHVIVSGLGAMILVGLVLIQPDLGSAMVMFATWFLMLLIVGIRRSHLAVLIALVLVTVFVSWFFVLADFQRNRIMTFINPQADPLGSGYNVSQSIIAVGSGQLFGRGFGLGSQSQLHFLPEPGTDFIFAVLAEEFGFIGVIVLLGLYALLIYRLIRLSQRSQDNFVTYFCLSLVAMLLVQLFINIGMNMGVAPVTGIPLPMVSAGGSSLLATVWGLAIANSMVIDRQ